MNDQPSAGKRAPGMTKEIRLQRKLQRAYEAQCRALFELMPGSVLLLDAGGVVRDANPSFCRHIGYKREELLGLHVSRFSQESPASIQQNLARLLAGETLHHEVTNVQKDGSLRYYDLHETAVILPDGSQGILAVSNDITDRRLVEQQRENLIRDLTQALAQVKTLRGLLPICAGCKKIRDDRGYWNHVETYIERNSDASFTHGLCPACAIKTMQDGGVKVPKDFLKNVRRRRAR
ncbi:MAG: PAS domain S-box protein [Verrucomicrobia bacterium]|nr:PAS domain S-box protein [Verrucomicrobiota bacterium]